MRPLSDDRPKALVEVNGQALIEHMIRRLEEAGVERIVVNVHAFADTLEAHLRARRGDAEILISDERPRLLETGGGVKKARPLLGEGPAFIANIDSVWIEQGGSALEELAAAWRPGEMEALLLLTETERAMGFDGPGDFFMDDEGRLSPRRLMAQATSAPFAYAGVQILDPRRVYEAPEDAFSLFPSWAAMSLEGRLRGQRLRGEWMHVGDPAALAAAERRLARS
jgi:MurNAc alpha-1-phosphate uridylyltransferase